MESEKIADAPEDMVQRGLRYGQEQWGEILAQTEDYVRANPTRAVCYGLAAGFLLDRLPVFRIMGGLLRLMLKAFKPVILIFGATKLYQMMRDSQE